MPRDYLAWASALNWELWEKILLPELLSWIPPWRIIDAPAPFKKSTKRDIILLADNGTESRITGKAAEQGAGAYQSARLDDIWMDEEHPEEVYDELQPRLLRRGGRSIATMTPLKGLTYVHGRIYEPVRTGAIPPERHWYSHAGIRDNPSITAEARADMLEEMKHNPSQLAARDQGLFVRPFGAVLPWEVEKHTIEVTPERMILHQARGAWYGGLDLGKWRFAFIFGVANTDGELLIVDEYFEQTGDVDVRAKGMHDLLRSYRVVDISIPADCADPNGIRELNEAFERIGSPYRVYAIDGNLKARQAGISRVESMLNRGALKVRKGMGQGRTWYYGRKASNFGRPIMGSRWMWEIANWQYPKTAEGKVQKDDPDDATADGADMMDGTRYLIMQFFPADEPAKVKRTPTRAERIAKEMAELDRQEREQDEPAVADRFGGVLRQ
jgi:phage terminase large subunit-like protein